MTEPEGRDPADDAAMRRRLSDLSRDLSRGASPPDRGATKPADTGMGQAISLGVRVTSEFVAAIVVGAVIGWQLDRWFNSSPAALILFIGLGMAAGLWNIYRVATKTGGR